MLVVNEKEYFLIMDLLKEHSLELWLSIVEMTEEEKKELKTLYKYKSERLKLVQQLEDKFMLNIGTENIQKSF